MFWMDYLGTQTSSHSSFFDQLISMTARRSQKTLPLRKTKEIPNMNQLMKKEEFMASN